MMYKTLHRKQKIPTKTGGELRCSGRISNVFILIRIQRRIQNEAKKISTNISQSRDLLYIFVIEIYGSYIM